MRQVDLLTPHFPRPNVRSRALNRFTQRISKKNVELDGCPAPNAPHGPCGGTCELLVNLLEAFSSNSGSAPSKKDYIVKRNNDRNGAH